MVSCHIYNILNVIKNLLYKTFLQKTTTIIKIKIIIKIMKIMKKNLFPSLFLCHIYISDLTQFINCKAAIFFTENIIIIH